MKRVAKLELGLWTACAFFGAAVLFIETRIVSARALRDDVIPFHADAYNSAVASSQTIEPAPATLSPAAPTPAGVDTRLVANLLVESVVHIESSGNPRMVGRHGERGLMQIKAGTWADTTRDLFGKRVSFDRAFEAKLNRQVGAAYLAYLQGFLSKHRKSWKADERSLLLACYNAGPERVRQAGFDLRRLPARTKDYVKRASALHDAYLADHNMSLPQLRLAVHGTPAVRQGS